MQYKRWVVKHEIKFPSENDEPEIEDETDIEVEEELEADSESEHEMDLSTWIKNWEKKEKISAKAGPAC